MQKLLNNGHRFTTYSKVPVPSDHKSPLSRKPTLSAFNNPTGTRYSIQVPEEIVSVTVLEGFITFRSSVSP